jgi:hypothetical protein
MITALTQAHVRRRQGLAALGQTRDKIFLARCTLSLSLRGSRDESRSDMRVQNGIRTTGRLPSSEETADLGGLVRCMQKIVSAKGLATKS